MNFVSRSSNKREMLKEINVVKIKSNLSRVPTEKRPQRWAAGYFLLLIFLYSFFPLECNATVLSDLGLYVIPYPQRLR